MFDNVNFQVEAHDLFSKNGSRVSPDMGRGLYRKDTGELIAMCGPGYKVVNHMDVISPIMDHLDAQGYAIHEREADVRALYDLRGKKGAFVNAQADKLGAVMRTDIIMGDFVQPKPSMSYKAKGEDTMFHRVTLLNSHDGSMAVHCNTSYLRLICLNGMVSAKWTAGTRAKHTTRINVEALRAKIANSVQLMSEDSDLFGKYASTKITKEQAKEFFSKTICKLQPEADGTEKVSESLLNQMLVNFRHEDQTVWGVWNAMTAWATHGETRATAGRLTTGLHRDQRVATAMRSKDFAALLR